MAFLSKKEFSVITGIKTNYISIYAKRGKIVFSGDLIDDTNAVNKEFIEKKLEQLEDGGTIPVLSNPNVKPHVVNGMPKFPLLSEDEEADINATQEVGNLSSMSDKQLTTLGKKKNIQKMSEEIALLKIKKEKLHGILIPTELVKSLIVQYSKGVSTSFHQAVENVLVIFAAESNLSSKRVAELRGELIKITNKAITDGLNDSKKGLQNIVNEYSETRGKGERK